MSWVGRMPSPQGEAPPLPPMVIDALIKARLVGSTESQGPSLDLTKTELGPTIGRAPKRQTRSTKLFVRRPRHEPCLAKPREGT